MVARAEMLDEAARLERQAEFRQRSADDLRRWAGDLAGGLRAATGWVDGGVWDAQPAVDVREATRDTLHDIGAGAEDILQVARRLDGVADDLRDEAWLLRRDAEADDTFGFLGL